MAYRRGPYYYRSRREDKKVVSEYLGKGDIGYLCALMDEEERAEREEARKAWKKEKEELRVVDKMVNNMAAQIRNITRVILLVEGYHTHKGQWRKRRNGSNVR